MKKLLFVIIACMGVITGLSQNVYLGGQDKPIEVYDTTFYAKFPRASVDSFVGRIEAITGKKLHFSHDKQPDDEHVNGFDLKDSAGSVVFELFLARTDIGKDVNLKIAGRPVYEFDHIEGQYLDIFPIWEKTVDTTADLVQTSKIDDYTKKVLRNVHGSNSIYQTTVKLKNNHGGYWSILIY